MNSGCIGPFLSREGAGPQTIYLQTVQPSRYCRDSTDLKACVPNPAYTSVRTTNVPRSACSSIHARWQQLLKYNGRGDVSSARANAALGVIHCAHALALRAGKRSFFRCAVTEIKVVNHASQAYS